jgi:hypothetical protein
VVRGRGSRLEDFREVLDRGSPLPLFHHKGERTKSARGLAQSTTLARSAWNAQVIRVHPWLMTASSNSKFIWTAAGSEAPRRFRMDESLTNKL